jgi:hypothetical protein
MAKPKSELKQGRAFLNTPKSNCTAAVRWNASLDYWEVKASEGIKARVNGEIALTEEALSHWVGRKADLRALRNMRRELDAFEDALVEFFAKAEEYNAKSQD